MVAETSFEVVAFVLATTLSDSHLTEVDVRCHALVRRVSVPSIFAADSIMQARLHGDLVPRAIGGKLDVSCVKRRVAPG